MNHEHFPGCGHEPDQLQVRNHDHEHPHEHSHGIGMVACSGACSCPAHNQNTQNNQFDNENVSWLQREAALRAVKNEDDDDYEIDPITGRRVPRKRERALAA